MILLDILKNAPTIVILGIINFIVVGLPGVGTYYLLDWMGLPQIVINVASLFVAAFFGGVWASVIVVAYDMHILYDSRKTTSRNAQTIQEKVNEITKKYQQFK